MTLTLTDKEKKADTTGCFTKPLTQHKKYQDGEKKKFKNVRKLTSIPFTPNKLEKITLV